MTHDSVRIHKQRLDGIFNVSSRLSVDDEVLSHWGRYCCVLASGFVEESVRVLVNEYAKNRAHAKLHRYIAANVRQFQNADMEKLRKLLERFDPSLWHTFESRVQDQHRDAVTSLIKVRHAIAHGESTGISFAVVKRYYESAIVVVSELEAVLRQAG